MVDVKFYCRELSLDNSFGVSVKNLFDRASDAGLCSVPDAKAVLMCCFHHVSRVLKTPILMHELETVSNVLENDLFNVYKLLCKKLSLSYVSIDPRDLISRYGKMLCLESRTIYRALDFYTVISSCDLVEGRSSKTISAYCLKRAIDIHIVDKSNNDICIVCGLTPMTLLNYRKIVDKKIISSLRGDL